MKRSLPAIIALCIVTAALLSACLSSHPKESEKGTGTSTELRQESTSTSETEVTVTPPPQTETEPFETTPRETEPIETTAPETEPDNAELVPVLSYIPTIYVDLKYATSNNFTGKVIYTTGEACLRYGTVKKLAEAQGELMSLGYSLKIWDAYRPASAQFILWDAFPNSKYISNPNKGYSGHSRGDTVDITLVKADGTDIPMPSGFDEFSPLADRIFDDVPEEAARNAKLLEKIMVCHGFKGYAAEWWHYSDTTKYPIIDDRLNDAK